MAEKFTVRRSLETSVNKSLLKSTMTLPTKKPVLVEASASRESYVPLTSLNKIMLANLLDQLIVAFLEQVQTKVSDLQFLLPAQFE